MTDVDDLRKQLNSANADLRVLREQLNSAHALLNCVQADLVIARADLRAKDALIERQNEQLRAKDALIERQNERHQQQLAVKDEQIGQQQQQLRAKDERHHEQVMGFIGLGHRHHEQVMGFIGLGHRVLDRVNGDTQRLTATHAGIDHYVRHIPPLLTRQPSEKKKHVIVILAHQERDGKYETQTIAGQKEYVDRITKDVPEDEFLCEIEDDGNPIDTRNNLTRALKQELSRRTRNQSSRKRQRQSWETVDLTGTETSSQLKSSRRRLIDFGKNVSAVHL